MKQLQLIDRVVVEIRGEEGTSERLSLVHIANELRKVAEQIENGMKGDEWVEEDIRTHEHREVLFEHECTEFGFRIGNKSLICQYYYKSEPKPKKYIIIAHNYDRENSSAYPVGGIFATEESAKEYLRTHIDEIKSNHWTATRVDGKDHYSEEFTCTGWIAEDMCDGSSLEVEIHEMEDEP